MFGDEGFGASLEKLLSILGAFGVSEHPRQETNLVGKRAIDFVDEPSERPSINCLCYGVPGVECQIHVQRAEHLEIKISQRG